MKSIYSFSLLVLLMVLWSPTMQAQDYSAMPEEARRQMQSSDYDSYDEEDVSTKRDVQLRWVEQQYQGGDKYVGYKKGDMNHGQGTYIWADGSRYEGEFNKNTLSGFGTLYSADGVKFFEGEFKNDQPHGVGTLYFSNGNRYVGEWENGVESGSGILYGPNNRVIYGGHWVNGVPNGNGSYYWEDGSKYVGQFRSGKSHGTGILYDAEGKIVYSGTWADDKPAK